MKLKQFFRYAARSMRRGGQRMWIAVFSVAFGVMSLYAMSSLSGAIAEVLLVDPRHSMGGEARLYRPGEHLSEDDVAVIRQMQTEGLIADFAVIETPGALALKTPDSGRVTILRSGIGFEPGTYPMMGELVITRPSGATPEDVLQEAGDVILTQDIVRERELDLGDEVILSSRLGGRPVHVRVVGIATITPGYKGESIYYGLETSRIATGREHPYDAMVVTWGNSPAAAAARLEADGWKVRHAGTRSPRDEQMSEMFDFMLKYAGILGLVIGGIGIANTMQVLLTRRKEEVAILKTLGYAQRDMVTLFVVETAIMGMSGSLLGVGLGAGLSCFLVNLASRIVTLYLPWRFDLLLAAGGFAVGVATTILFAANAILQASDARPALLFRHTSIARQRWPHSLGMFALMAVPFGLISSLILGSILKGFGILLIALAGLLVLGALLGGVMWLVLRLLPTFTFHSLRMARNNMRRRGLSLVFAMIALFTGVFTLGLSITTISASREQSAMRSFSLEGVNMVVLADPAQENEIRTALSDQGVKNVQARYLASVDHISGVNGHYIEARNEPWDIEISGASWGSAPSGAYVPAHQALPLGSPIEITGVEGQRRTLVVAGTYEPTESKPGLFDPAGGVMVSRDVLLELSGGDHYFMVGGEADVARLTAIRDSIGEMMPDTSVITSVDVDSFFSGTLRNLSTFAGSMAGLALLAGAILIANAVSLAMIERRYEIGVLKTMGYTSGKILRMVMFEYGLIAVIASVLGVLGVEGFVLGLQSVQETASELLHVNAVTGLVIVMVGVGCTLLSAAAMAWNPIRGRPLIVLGQTG
jgi:putative ABC transport system permease protein